MNSLDPNLLTQTLHNFFTHNAHLLPNYIPDSRKVSILLWTVPNKTNTFLLKIANQKYLSSYRVDKNGTAYWKFREVERDEEPEPQLNPSLSEATVKTNPVPTPPNLNPQPLNTNPIQSFIPDPTNLDPVAKFYQRQAKTKVLQENLNNHDEANTTINHSDHSPTVSQ